MVNENLNQIASEDDGMKHTPCAVTVDRYHLGSIQENKDQEGGHCDELMEAKITDLDSISGNNVLSHLRPRPSLEKKYDFPFQGIIEEVYPFRNMRESLKPTSSIRSVQDALEDLSPNAESALEDFQRRLDGLGKKALDEDGFKTLLDDFEYKGEVEGLFNGLLDDIRDANPGFSGNVIYVDNMYNLYKSESYHMLDNGKPALEYIDKLFENFDVNNSGDIDKNEVSLMIEKLIGRRPTQEETDTTFQVLYDENSKIIDKKHFRQWLFRPNENHHIEKPRNIKQTLLDPSLTPEKFVEELERYTLSHEAINHPFLQNLSSDKLDKDETLDLLLRFFAAYSHFNKGFVGNVERLRDALTDETHKKILQENLDEENGNYDEEILIELEKMGIEREYVENIPHPELYRDMVATLEKKHNRSYSVTVSENIVAIKRSAMDDLIADGKIGLLAAVYFGSELIVPKLYSQLLEGLKQSCGISNRDARFLILHIDMDHDHAEHLREIVIANCITIEDREKLVTNTTKILNARAQSYDALLGHSGSLGEFECRSKILEMCEEHLAGVTKSDVPALPKKLKWNDTAVDDFVVMMPQSVNLELCDAALQCYQRGLSIDDITIGKNVDAKVFNTIEPFCASIRSKLLQQTGAVVIKGLDMESLGGAQNMEKMEACSKIAYFLICEHIGTVDGGARGKLFDVKDHGKDSEDDNVLFSVSNSELGWHTDGASKSRTYDAVGLLCISPASNGGGEFKLSNACNVYDDMAKVLPKFMMYELTRPLPRDILENGDGLGSAEDIGTTLSRSKDILKMRIHDNIFPIYAVDGDRMRFRYMRHWIITGHRKGCFRVPTLLRIAMDILDDTLDKDCLFNKALERGDMVFSNNAIIAHAREKFDDAPGYPPRHKVRAWLQIRSEPTANSHDEKEDHEVT